MQTNKLSKIALSISLALSAFTAYAEGWEPILVTPDIKPKKYTEIQSQQQLDIETIYERQQQFHQSARPNSVPNAAPTTPSNPQIKPQASQNVAPTAPVRFANEAQAKEYFLQNTANPGAIAVSMFNNNLNYRDVARITGYSEEQVRSFLRPSNADLAKYIEENKNNPDNIRKVANLYGLTQGDLVGATGYSVQDVSRYFGTKALDRDIKNLIEQNVSNPVQMVNLLDQYKISPEDASRATGISISEVNRYIAAGRAQNPQAANTLTSVLSGSSTATSGGYAPTSHSPNTSSTGQGAQGQSAATAERQPNLGEVFANSLTQTQQQAIDQVQNYGTSFNSSVSPFAAHNLSNAILNNTQNGRVGTSQKDVTIRSYVMNSTHNPNAVKQYVTNGQVTIDDISRATGLTNSQVKEFLQMN